MKEYTTAAQREHHWDTFRNKLRDEAIAKQGAPKEPSKRKRSPPRINY
jgi:hypothetical protein